MCYSKQEYIPGTIMNRPLKIIVRIFFRMTAYFIVAVIIYFLSALILSAIPVNTDFQETETSGVGIYLLSNGVHTDLVLPVRTMLPATGSLHDWSDVIPFHHTLSNDSLMQYIAFGWGDKNFYRETPTWADLKASTAFNALFFLSTSALHVTFYRSMSENEYCRKIGISEEQYVRLVRYIDDSFLKTGDGDRMLIHNLSYGNDDCFYDANGTFSLFYTCNTWTNQGLRQSGLKASVWTPFEGSLMNHYK